MKTFTLYRLYDGDDEIEELGWHICKTYAEWAKSLYPNPLYEVEVRKIPVVIDTERDAFFLYSYDGEYVSRQELVTLIGEDKVRRYEDLKFDPDHERPISHCEIDKHYDGGEKDGNTYGVEMLHIGMEDIGMEKVAPLSQNAPVRPLEEVEFFAVDPNAFKSRAITNEEANNMFGLITVGCALRRIHDHKKAHPGATQPATILTDHPAVDGSLLMVRITYENYKEDDLFSDRLGYTGVKPLSRAMSEEILGVIEDLYKPIGFSDGFNEEDQDKYALVDKKQVRYGIDAVCTALEHQLKENAK